MADTGALSTDDASSTDDDLITAWGLLTEAVVAIGRRLDEGLTRAGELTLQEFDVLIRLSREPHHRLPMSLLAREIGLTSGGFTKLADRMEHDGLIVRQHSTRDRRVVFAALTERGEHVTREVLARHICDLRIHLEAPLGIQRLTLVAEAMRALRDHHGLLDETAQA